MVGTISEPNMAIQRFFIHSPLFYNFLKAFRADLVHPLTPKRNIPNSQAHLILRVIRLQYGCHHGTARHIVTCAFWHTTSIQPIHQKSVRKLMKITAILMSLLQSKSHQVLIAYPRLIGWHKFGSILKSL